MALPTRPCLGLIAVLMSSAALSGPVLAQTVGALPPGVEAEWLTQRDRPALYTDVAGVPSRESTMAAVEYVASSQIAAMAAEPLALSTGSNLTQMSSNWVAATFYVGASRLARVSDDARTLRFLSAVADHYNYSVRGARSGKTMLNADDIAIGNLYEELYARRGQEGVLMPLRQRLDWQVAYLARAEDTPALVWWWADALDVTPISHPAITRVLW
ncbi:glycoside hydrolase family 88 protein [Brevundimonas sp. BT-123]|uniref:glycoside hydrolase family 88 protein n=1 Tax=Brevundimonas sp. BT-123 TaxID=2986928 RepID=UPI00223615E7|nr:glycoside hydrolase family 88 protein [Brevundimonas sp. BT-123]MCW0046539.1 glycoside hydrolase family 88 protein [Brevundimonas sp. BT-123]